MTDAAELDKCGADARTAPATASEGATEGCPMHGERETFTTPHVGYTKEPGCTCTMLPATGVTSSDGDRGLSAIVDADRWEDVSTDDLIERAIEAIAWGLLDATSDTADRWPSKESHDAARATAKRILAARTAQPEGTERVEWSTWIAREQRGYDDRADAQRRAERDGSAVVRRTVTEYAPVIGPWEVVGDE